MDSQTKLKVLEMLQNLLMCRDASNFCGCYEGDIDGAYENGCKDLIDAFREALNTVWR